MQNNSSWSFSPCSFSRGALGASPQGLAHLIPDELQVAPRVRRLLLCGEKVPLHADWAALRCWRQWTCCRNSNGSLTVTLSPPAGTCVEWFSSWFRMSAYSHPPLSSKLGGRGKDNGWIITFPENSNFNQMPEEVVTKVLSYLTRIPRYPYFTLVGAVLLHQLDIVIDLRVGGLP